MALSCAFERHRLTTRSAKPASSGRVSDGFCVCLGFVREVVTNEIFEEFESGYKREGD